MRFLCSTTAEIVSSTIFPSLDARLAGLILHYGDLADSTNLISLVNSISPHEIYNLAAQSHVKARLDLGKGGAKRGSFLC